jgi:predicted GNAT superfamily acetyltransferase
MPAALIQVQLPVPYRREPRNDERLRSYLDRGYRIVHYQRLSDAEVVVTLEAPSPSA